MEKLSPREFYLCTGHRITLAKLASVHPTAIDKAAIAKAAATGKHADLPIFIAPTAPRPIRKPVTLHALKTQLEDMGFVLPKTFGELHYPDLRNMHINWPHKVVVRTSGKGSIGGARITFNMGSTAGSMNVALHNAFKLQRIFSILGDVTTTDMALDIANIESNLEQE